MPNQLAALPQGTTGNALVLAVNDRLRRIAQSAEEASKAAAAAQATADGTQAAIDGARTTQLFDTYNNWTTAKYNPAGYPAGTTFNVSDWNNVIYRVQSVAGVRDWVYFSGIYQTVQASIPTKGFDGAALGSNDTGLEINVTDYAHVLRWTGTAYAFALNDSSGYIVDALAVPLGGVWGACDGSSYLVLQPNGTTVSVTTPAWNGSDAFEEATGTHAAGALSAASAGVTPTTTESTPHTHTLSTFGIFEGTGTAVSLAIGPATGTESPSHTHLAAAPGETAGGLPKRVAFLKYLRR